MPQTIDADLGIVSAHGAMTGVAFEQPAVAGVIRKFIRQYDAGKSVSTLGGDYRTDDQEKNDPMHGVFSLVKLICKVYFLLSVHY